MAEFTCRIQEDGGLNFGDRGAALFRQYRKDNPGALLKITPVLPESSKQRGYLEGCIIALITHLQEGMDHRNADDCRNVRQWLKSEFNGTYLTLGGTVHKIGKSTKGREALNAFLERV